jgi:hypothetical protein
MSSSIFLYASDHLPQAALLSDTPADHDLARDMIAALITQHHGEYVFRIGLQPPHAKLFAGDLSDDLEGWTGIARTEQELDAIQQGITTTVEEVGGKVCDSSFSRDPMSYFFV